MQVHLQEIQLQHDATWRTLDAAIRQRDLVAGFHGALVAAAGIAAPLAISARGSGQVMLWLILAISDAAGLLLVFLSGWSLRGAQGLRILQIEQEAAGRHASAILLGARGGYFDHGGSVRVQPLARQLDPMGLTVATIRQYLLADVWLAAAVVVASVLESAATGFGLGGGADAVRTALAIAVASIAVATAGTVVARGQVDRRLRAGEARAQAEISARLEDARRRVASAPG